MLLRGHQYQARLLPGTELTANPLNLLAYDLSGVDDVGQWSLVVAGRDNVQAGPGFILLATRVDAVAATRPVAKSCRITPVQS